MRLTNVCFEEFRSIFETSIDVERGITSLVGINESGKSNVLLAIEKIDKKKNLENVDISKNSDRVYYEAESPKLQLEFELNDNEINTLYPLFGIAETNKNSLRRIVLKKEKSTYSLCYPEIDYKNSSLMAEKELELNNSNLQNCLVNEDTLKAELAEKKRQLDEEQDATKKTKLKDSVIKAEEAIQKNFQAKKVAENELKEQEKQKIKERELIIRKELLDSIVKTHLPKVLLFDSVNIPNFYLPDDGRILIQKLIDKPNSHKPVVNLLKLGGIDNLAQLQTDNTSKKNDLRKQLLERASRKINNDLLRKHWPLKDVRFELGVENGDTLTIHLKEGEDTSVFVPGERSRGLQWSIAFNIYFLSESVGGELQNSILLIDEPGVFLHIDAQEKLLKETFPEILKGENQIIYTTHLPYLIHPEFPERIRIVERDDEDHSKTIIGNKAWSEGKLGEIPEPVKTALGTKWSEWFSMKDKNCIVEGPSDQIILRSLTTKVGGTYNFVPAYGKDKILSGLALSKVEKKNSIGIIDNDLTVEKHKEMLQNLHLININSDVLHSLAEMSGNTKVVTIEDIIPDPIYREVVGEIYQHLFKGLQDFDINSIPTDAPRIKSFEKFAQQICGKPIKFKKMDVARTLAKIVDQIKKLPDTDMDWTIVRQLNKKIEDSLSAGLLAQDRKESKTEG